MNQMQEETSPTIFSSNDETPESANDKYVNTDTNLEDVDVDIDVADESVTSFEEMGLRTEVFRGIVAFGFEKPSVIQQRAIPAFVKHKRDIIAQAQSGTGKTATFSVAVLQKVDPACKSLQSIILAPTRELASQIHGVITALGQFTKINISMVSGGGNVRRCVDQLHADAPQIIVGTPGRILHMIRDRYISTQHVHTFVMDEADELLTDGFSDQVRDIIAQLSDDTQIGLYTATVTEQMNEIVTRFMRNPIEIKVAREQLTLEGIRQYKIILEQENWKLGTLMDLYSSISIYQMMIYCNSKRNAEYLKRNLNHEEIPCEAIHSELAPEERSSIMRRFREGDIRVLVTTDLLCRGIDVQQVSLVINYDIPRDVASYLHRIGRGGRFGRKGYALNMVVKNNRDQRRRQNDVEQLSRIENYYETQIDVLPSDLKAAFS